MSPAPASTPSEATPVKPLRGRTLALARGTWLVVAVLALGFFAAGIPSEFVIFHTVCQDACSGGQVTQAGSGALRDLGLSVDFYAAYAVALDTVFATVYVTVAAIIFWRKSDERMALLVSFALLTFGTAVLPNAMDALSIEHASLWWPLSLLNFLGAASFGLFLYLFPDGRFVPGWTRWVVFAWIAWQLPTYWLPSWDSYDLDGWLNWLAITVWHGFPGHDDLHAGLPLLARLGRDGAPADQMGGLRDLGGGPGVSRCRRSALPRTLRLPRHLARWPSS